MKSINEKAKAYDEAKYIMKEYLESGNAGVVAENTIKKAFPELSESEDGIIIAALKSGINGLLKKEYHLKGIGGISFDRIIDWLEKQAQKPANWFQELEDKLANATPKQLAEWKEKYFKEEPAEWSEEDEEVLDALIRRLEGEDVYVSPHLAAECLKSLKDRVQPKRVILEKLEEWLDEYVSSLADVDTASLICSFTNYLDGKLPKSLRPKNTWKPSDEQMRILDLAIRCGINRGTTEETSLVSLFNDLKKLREE